MGGRIGILVLGALLLAGCAVKQPHPLLICVPADLGGLHALACMDPEQFEQEMKKQQQAPPVQPQFHKKRPGDPTT